MLPTRTFSTYSSVCADVLRCSLREHFHHQAQLLHKNKLRSTKDVRWPNTAAPYDNRPYSGSFQLFVPRKAGFTLYDSAHEEISRILKDPYNPGPQSVVYDR